MKKFICTSLNEFIYFDRKKELNESGFLYIKNPIYKDMVVYHFSRKSEVKKNAEILCFSKIDKNYVINFDWDFIIKLKADVKSIMPFDSHTYSDEFGKKYLDLKYILEKGEKSMKKSDLEYLSYIKDNLTKKDFIDDKKLKKILGRNIIDLDYPYNECICTNNRLIKVYNGKDKNELLKDLKDDEALVKSNPNSVFLNTK